MFRLNFLVRDPISFVVGQWRATVDLVLGRVVTILYRYIYVYAYIYIYICMYTYICIYVHVYIHI